MKNVARNWYFRRRGRATVKCDFAESSNVSTTSLSGIGSSAKADEPRSKIASAARRERVMKNLHVRSATNNHFFRAAAAARIRKTPLMILGHGLRTTLLLQKGELPRYRADTLRASGRHPTVDRTEARNSQVSGVRIPECPQHLNPAFEPQHLSISSICSI